MPETTTDTQQARLARAFETLQEHGITPVLVLAAPTGVRGDDLSDYTFLAGLSGSGDAWVGAHAGAQHPGAAHWSDGVLCYRATGVAIQQLWFSFPIGREDVARTLLDALDAQAFYASWFSYDEAGDIVGPGTAADRVRLVLKEEN